MMKRILSIFLGFFLSLATDENSGSIQFWYLQDEDFEKNVKNLLPCLEIPESNTNTQ